MTESLWESDPTASFESFTSEIVKPPFGMAITAAALAGISLASAADLRGRAAFIGWALGFGAVIAGIAYRWVLRRRQLEPLYLPNKRSDRLMLLGVFGGFLGIVVNAVLIAQRTIT